MLTKQALKGLAADAHENRKRLLREWKILVSAMNAACRASGYETKIGDGPSYYMIRMEEDDWQGEDSKESYVVNVTNGRVRIFSALLKRKEDGHTGIASTSDKPVRAEKIRPDLLARLISGPLNSTATNLNSFVADQRKLGHEAISSGRSICQKLLIGQTGQDSKAATEVDRIRLA